jgi:hypothetical protein
MTPAELLTDYRGLRANLKRIAQVAAVAERRWHEHEQACTLCRLELDGEDDGPVCAEGLGLYSLAVAYECAVLTIRGAMSWA